MSASTQRLPYDYGSIMHYPVRAFSSNGRPTIEPIRPTCGKRIGQRDALSRIDWAHVQRAYCRSYSNMEVQSMGKCAHFIKSLN